MVSLILLMSLVAAPPVDDVDSLVRYALDHHPAVAVAEATQAAAAARIDAAGSLPDPQLRWAEMLEPVQTRVGPQERILGLQQSLPWPGTLGSRREAAASRQRSAAADIRMARVQVAAGVQEAWARAAWLTETEEVAGRQLDLVTSLETAVRAAYEAGQGRYGDLLQVQLEAARIDDRLRSLQDQREAVRAALNVSLGREPDQPLDLPRGLGAAEGARVARPDADLPPDHPQLAALEHRRQAARSDAEAARRAGRPSLALGLDWIQVGEAVMPGVDDSGHDALVARLGISVPLWRGKHDGARRAAEAQAGSLAARATERRQALAAQITAATVAWRDAERRRDLHRHDLLPRARRMYETILAAYQADGAGIADVLSAQRSLLELEQELLAARRDLLLAAADLDRLTGVVPVDN